MLKKEYCFLAVILVILSGCKKGTEVHSVQYANVYVTSKNYIQTPVVAAYIDSVLLGDIEPNGFVRKLFARGDQPLKLSVKDTTTGEVYLDTSFTPSVTNDFTVLIDNALGIRQFYVPSGEAPRPVAPDSFRVQLFHKIEYQGVPKKVTFKIFEDLSNISSKVDLHELPIQVTVPYGEVSKELNIPYEMKPDGIPKKYRMKAFDAETGQILVDINTSTPIPGRLDAVVAPGEFKLINVKVRVDATTGRINWAFTVAEAFDPLQ